MKAAEATGSFVFARRRLDGLAAVQLSQYLRDDCHARFIDISFLGRWNECSLAIAAALKYGLREARSLTLDGNDICSCPEVLEAWCSAIEEHPGLQHLSLRDTGLDDSGAARIAKALRGHVVLFSVDVGRNRIYDPGVIALANGVNENNVILEVNVEGTDSSSVSRHRLNQVLDRNRSRFPERGGAAEMLRGLQLARAVALTALSRVSVHMLQMTGSRDLDPSEVVDSLIGTGHTMVASAPAAFTHSTAERGATFFPPVPPQQREGKDAATHVFFDAEEGPSEELLRRCEAGWRYSAADRELLNELRSQIADLRAESRLEHARAEEILAGVGEAQKRIRVKLEPSEQELIRLKEELSTEVEATKRILQDRIQKQLSLKKLVEEVEDGKKDLSRYKLGAEHLDHILKLRNREVAEEAEQLERRLRTTKQEMEALEADNVRCRKLLQAMRFETDRERFCPPGAAEVAS